MKTKEREHPSGLPAPLLRPSLRLCKAQLGLRRLVFVPGVTGVHLKVLSLSSQDEEVPHFFSCRCPLWFLLWLPQGEK